jgi:NhaA family Na+:H+ antiporter
MNKVFSRERAIRRREIRNIFSILITRSSVGGILLMIITALTLVAANIPEISAFFDIWKIRAAVMIGSFVLEMTLLNWVNDVLMAIFFFVVGLEIKREMMVGELSSFRKASLPIFAALGGMILPALIFHLFNQGEPSASGWGIPMATDIAFSLAVISLLGRRVPLSIKIFLTALAIVDDIGAILVLAIFYPSHEIQFHYIVYALIVIVILITFNRMNLHNSALYLIPGVFLWYFTFESGIHATIAGVALAMCIPSKSPINEVRFYVRSKYYLEKFKDAGNGEVNILANPRQLNIIHKIHSQIRQMNPLINRFEHTIHPYVTYSIMPVFAVANAGVTIDSISVDTLLSPLSLGIFFGLLMGKPFGIFIVSFIACKLKITELPEGMKWKQLFSVGILAGIGFTMSIFINSLAFSNQAMINSGKAAIIITSVTATLAGLVALGLTLGKRPKKVKYKKIRDPK